MGKIQNTLREIQSIGRDTRELLIQPGAAPAFARHGIRLAGISRAASGFHFVRHRPDMGQHLVCFRGAGRVWIDGEWVECREGQAYLTPPGQFHAYKSGARWQIGWVILEPDALLAAGERPMLREVNPAPFERILLGLHEENTSSQDPAALDHWVELLRHHCARITGTGHSSRLWRLWQRVQQDIGFPWTLRELARVSGLGHETLRLVCLRENGRSPLAQVRHLRMQHAASLLGTGQKVEFVSRVVGYENSYAFSTAFRREMTRPPSAFQP